MAVSASPSFTPLMALETWCHERDKRRHGKVQLTSFWIAFWKTSPSPALLGHIWKVGATMPPISRTLTTFLDLSLLITAPPPPTTPSLLCTRYLPFLDKLWEFWLAQVLLSEMFLLSIPRCFFLQVAFMWPVFECCRWPSRTVQCEMLAFCGQQTSSRSTDSTTGKLKDPCLPPLYPANLGVNFLGALAQCVSLSSTWWVPRECFAPHRAQHDALQIAGVQCMFVILNATILRAQKCSPWSHLPLLGEVRSWEVSRRKVNMDNQSVWVSTRSPLLWEQVSRSCSLQFPFFTETEKESQRKTNLQNSAFRSFICNKSLCKKWEKEWGQLTQVICLLCGCAQGHWTVSPGGSREPSSFVCGFHSAWVLKTRLAFVTGNHTPQGTCSRWVSQCLMNPSDTFICHVKSRPAVSWIQEKVTGSEGVATFLSFHSLLPSN